jgi:hypothetical protein
LRAPAIFSVVGNYIGILKGGLMCTFTPSTSTGALVGFQILSGVSRGLTSQQHINVIQSTLDPSNMVIGTSIVVFSQIFGGTMLSAFGETNFRSPLRSAPKQYAPGVNANLIFEIGAADSRDAVTSEQLPEL